MKFQIILLSNRLFLHESDFACRASNKIRKQLVTSFSVVNHLALVFRATTSDPASKTKIKFNNFS